MDMISRHVLNLLLFLVIAPAVFYMNTTRSSAQDELVCMIEATKVAMGAGSQEFLFTGFAGGEPIPPFTLVDGQSTGGPIPEGVTVVITEEPQDGWIFGGIECEGDGGLVVTNLENGFTLECVNPKLGSATCVIRNLQVVSTIPTLSEWGLIAMAGLIGIVGFIVMRRRKVTA